MKSLESELKEAELLPGSLQDLTGDYGNLIKKLHSLTPLVIGLSGRVTKKDCIEILSVMCELRKHDFPAFENKIRGLRDDVKKKLNLIKINRSEEDTKRIYDNFEKNKKHIKPKP